MNKRILIAVLLTISVLMVGCGNTNTKSETSNNSASVSQSKDSDSANKGSDTTLNSSDKSDKTNNYGTIQDLEKQGFQPKESQWRTTHFENFGEVVFVGGSKETDGKLSPNFYLTDKDSNILYKFSEFYGATNGTFKDIDSVSFMDLNNDQLLDIIVSASYQTDKGSVSVDNIFFQNGKEFKNDKNYDDLVNNAIANKTTDNAIDFIKKNPIK